MRFKFIFIIIRRYISFLFKSYIIKLTFNIINNDYISYLPPSKDNPYYLKITLNIRDFFLNDDIFNNLTNKNNNIKNFENTFITDNCVFIFNSLPLPFIVAAFKIRSVLLSGGSNSKRHIVSPVHFRLSQFITCVEGMRNNTVYNSYYDYLNLATQPIFDHTKLNKLMNFKDIHDYFNILELYFKIKANIEIDNTNFQ